MMRDRANWNRGGECPRLRLVPLEEPTPVRRGLAIRVGIGLLKVIAGLVVVVFFVLCVVTAFLGITGGAGRGRMA